MQPIEKLRQERLKKLNKIRRSGIDPYPAKTQRTYTNKEALDKFNKLSKIKKKITLVGRIRSIRSHGKITFSHIKDDSGSIQLLLKKDILGKDQYELFKNFDIGDFIQATGVLFKTKAGEKTLEVQKIRMLAKSLAPLPEKWHGLKDEEERFRKRYLDIMFNPEVKEMIVKKGVFWNAVREFLRERGFVEVETPVLENTPGGADARPFVTHHNALDIDVYLRISTGELWQKRLMAAGFEKTFEIGRQFRNEGIDPEHLQDYTQMEFYWAYADYEDGMKLVEEMYKYVALKTFNTLRFKIGKFNINLEKRWPRYEYRHLVKKYAGIDVLNTNLKEVERKMKELKIPYDKKNLNIPRGLDNIWKYYRKRIKGPCFVIKDPLILSPLARKDRDNPKVTQRFHPVIAGSDLGNGYSELNDPIDQAKRFEEQEKLRKAGDEEAQMSDVEFVEALEYGMPPTCGFGMSERLFSFLMNKSARECQIFPLLKPKKHHDKK